MLKVRYLNMIMRTYQHEQSSSTRVSRLQSVFICALLLLLSGCPDDPVNPPPEKDMAPEQDQSTFTYDIDVPDDGPPVEDMEPEVDTDVPVEDLTCQSCEEDSDCGEGARCIDFGEELGGRCFTECSGDDENEQCGEGFSCTALSADLEVCVNDSDSDCELCYDPDNDGYGAGGYCELGNEDCDDSSADVNPRATDDSCDGVDNNCDGTADEGYEPVTCGEGTCTAQSSCVDGAVVECVPPEVSSDDLTCDGVDDDCDGNVDEDYVTVTCGQGTCEARSSCTDGVEQACEAFDPEFADDLTCDGIDEDCDGNVDETFTGSCGQGICVRSATCSGGVESCEPRDPEVGEVDATCDNIDQDCDGNVDEGFVTEQTCGLGACQVTGSCVDGAYACTELMPSASDDTTCDGIDEDCDGEIDEDCQVNTLRAEYNAALSTPTRVALDIFYDQLVSPARVPENYQPTIALIAITIPQGMSINPPFIENTSYARGQSTIDSGKAVSVLLPPDEPNTRQFSILGLFEPAASSFLSPSVSGVGGHLLTIYVDVNGVAAPWNFSWSVAYTQLSPAAALEALELAPIAPISP